MSVLELTVTVPVLTFSMEIEVVPLPPMTVLELTVTVPLELLLIAKATDPLPPVSVLAFEKTIVPAADVDSTACAPFAIVVPLTLPPMATMPLIVSVPLDEKAIARVDSVNADPIA